MGRQKVFIPKEKLDELYHKKNLTPREIGKIYFCDGITVRNRLKEYKISLKSQAYARNRYKKYNFNGDCIEKAYLLGFRLGDLNVYIPSMASETIVVRSHSTIPAQTRLFKDLFKKYGRITCSTAKNGKNVNANCYLNKSFSFLCPKYNSKTRRWLLQDAKRMRAFSAGYIDAEGTFQLNQGKGRFKMDSYDYTVLRDIVGFFLGENINIKLRRIAKKDTPSFQGTWNNDLWRITVNESTSLEKFSQAMLLVLRHKLRIRDAQMVLNNIQERRNNGTIK